MNSLSTKEKNGKKTGENSGVAGSMHIFNPNKNLKAVSAIVSSTISTAVGNAYGNMLNKNNKITLSLFGDGATEEGVFHESVNFASLKKLPIVFLCLDNNIAVDVPILERQSYKEVGFRLKNKCTDVRRHVEQSFLSNRHNNFECAQIVLPNALPNSSSLFSTNLLCFQNDS